MPETRTKVYRVDTPQQAQAQAADTADAAAHGWHVVHRAFGSDGTLRLTYQHGQPPGVSEWASAAPPPAPAAPAPDPAGRLVSVVAAVGGGMVAAGAFLPWLTASSGLLSVSRGGLEGGDGWIAAAAGGVLLLLGVAALVGVGVNGAGWLVGLLAAIVAGLVGIVDLQDVNERIRSVESDNVVAQVGIGLWLILGGSVVGGIAALSGMVSRGSTPTGAGFARTTPPPKPKPMPEDTWRPPAG